MRGPERRGGLCTLVQPTNQAVREFQRQVHLDTVNAESAFDLACREIGRFRYTDTPGPVTNVESLLETRIGNCRDLSALIVSLLRAVGVHRSYVVLGSAPGRLAVALHAWAIAGDGSGYLLADPADCRPRQVSGEGFLELATPIAMFNDEECVVGTSNVRSILSSASTDQ